MAIPLLVLSDAAESPLSSETTEFQTAVKAELGSWVNE